MSATDVIDLRPEKHGPSPIPGSVHRVSDGAGASTTGHLSRRVSFTLLVSIAVTFLAAASAPTPLYAIYEAKWHFSPITLTVVFAVYAIAVLAALLTVGSLSDHIGRRPVLLAAIVLQVAALFVFATASGVSALFVARLIQGVATGGALGAVGAGLLDLDKIKGTTLSGVGTVSGTAIGALVSGLMVQFWPAPTRLIYVALLGMFVLEGVGVVLIGELSTKKVGAVASLRPHLAWPRAARAPLLIATPILVAIWAFAGLYASLGPTMVRLLTGSRSVALGGLSLFALALSGAVTALLANRVSKRTVLFHCTVALDRRRRCHGCWRCQQIDHRLLLGNGNCRNRVWLRVPGCHAISAPPGDTS